MACVAHEAADRPWAWQPAAMAHGRSPDMPTRTSLGYVALLMALGLAANVVDPQATSVWMRLSFLALGIGFFGEMAARGIVPERT